MWTVIGSCIGGSGGLDGLDGGKLVDNGNWGTTGSWGVKGNLGVRGFEVLEKIKRSN